MTTAVRSPRRAPLAQASASRAESAYHRLREDVFEFRLLPGDRFTETEIAERLAISRTPVREALMRLQSEGLVRGYFRSGWEVVPLDFARFDALYELRCLLETHAVRVLCGTDRARVDRARLDGLEAIWQIEKDARERDGRAVAQFDEAFHATLVEAAGNAEMARVHAEVTDRIRIVRRLDFTYDRRVAETYDEHAAILRAIRRRRVEQAVMLVNSHIAQSQAEVRKITLHRLHSVRAPLRGERSTTNARRASA